jgi:hypothetical protein
MFQRAYRATKGVELFQVILTESRNRKMMVKFAAICKGWIQRFRAAAKREWEKRCLEAVPGLTLFKAVYRGFHTRLRNREVRPGAHPYPHACAPNPCPSVVTARRGQAAYPRHVPALFTAAAICGFVCGAGATPRVSPPPPTRTPAGALGAGATAGGTPTRGGHYCGRAGPADVPCTAAQAHVRNRGFGLAASVASKCRGGGVGSVGVPITCVLQGPPMQGITLGSSCSCPAPPCARPATWALTSFAPLCNRGFTPPRLRTAPLLFMLFACTLGNKREFGSG